MEQLDFFFQRFSVRLFTLCIFLSLFSTQKIFQAKFVLKLCHYKRPCRLGELSNIKGGKKLDPPLGCSKNKSFHLQMGAVFGAFK